MQSDQAHCDWAPDAALPRPGAVLGVGHAVIGRGPEKTTGWRV